MKTIKGRLAGLALVGGLLALVGCAGNMIAPGAQRITFALVLDTRAYNGVAVIADVLDDFGGNVLETVSDALASYPNTA
jgi:hypothetical protein